MNQKPPNKWNLSKVKAPVAKVVAICAANPDDAHKDLVARCVKAGVAKATAHVRVSRWRKENGKV